MYMHCIAFIYALLTANGFGQMIFALTIANKW